jgi:protein-L-isoaspartate(D-aspartate) O-methyltransferase
MHRWRWTWRPIVASSWGADEPNPAGATRDAERARMVEHQIAARGVRDPLVLDAMRRVPREAFVPEEGAREAYVDGPLPIGRQQTISQPFIVAAMTEALGLRPDSKVLEIGTGSGYQTAVLAEITPRVFTIEIVPELAERAQEALVRLGYPSVRCRTGDGASGWAEEAPFDAILVTAAPQHVPHALVEQLAPGGRLCIPVGCGGSYQELVLVQKSLDGATSERSLMAVSFVPMTGAASTPG